MTDISETRQAYERQYGRITDDGVAKLRSRIGVPIPPQKFGNTMPRASEEAIRLWSWGIGDDNPLYIDGDYAKSTVWKGLIAQPSIVLGMDPHRLGIMGGLPGVHALYAGVNFRWYDAVREGVCVSTSAALKSVEERTGSKASGKAVKVTAEANIVADDGVKLATLEHVIMRHERSEMRERKSFTGSKNVIPYVYSDAEIEDIRQEYRNEVLVRRGSEPRIWNDVNVGDAMRLLKGPLTQTGVVAFAMAARPVTMTMGHRILFQLFDEHPGTAIPNSFNCPEPPNAVHWSETQAQFCGFPTAYDFGMERACWASQLFTDWMGDDAFLQSLSVKLRGLNYLGDLTRFSGRVEQKYLSASGDGAVRCSYEAVNQRGEVTTSGEAEILLPGKDGTSISNVLRNLPLQSGSS